ncbi:hypothetical protein NDU88_001462 [Pleurodeles waltl]|uniref:Uncharacterized protein n=1 Tax=Pleurodeles waltl TaxID=8319 RepID=A0AAV7UVF0_PLEWA|nr:hypothetical protein NDU88_001462 [Pleurodeles waltl]
MGLGSPVQRRWGTAGSGLEIEVEACGLCPKSRSGGSSNLGRGPEGSDVEKASGSHGWTGVATGRRVSATKTVIRGAEAGSAEKVRALDEIL